MKMKLFTLSSFLLLFFSIGSYAQSTENPIDAEFTDLIENSNNFQTYKVVDKNKLDELQTKTAAYISGLKEEIATYEESLQEQKKNIAELNSEVESVRGQLQEVTAEKDAIVFLGMPFSKSSYQSIMWGIVGILVLALVLFVYRFQKSNSQTKEARKRLNDTEAEFESYRVKALEKEQRMGRLLQDEKNKHLKSAK